MVAILTLSLEKAKDGTWKCPTDSNLYWNGQLVWTPGAKTINVFRACIGAQLTICAQKWRNFVLFSTVSLIFVLSRVCVFLYSLGPSSRTLFVREDMCRDAHVTSNVELRNNVRLLLNVELRNYVISCQIVEGRVTSDCYLNIVVPLDC